MGRLRDVQSHSEEKRYLTPRSMTRHSTAQPQYHRGIKSTSHRASVVATSPPSNGLPSKQAEVRPRQLSCVYLERSRSTPRVLVKKRPRRSHSPDGLSSRSQRGRSIDRPSYPPGRRPPSPSLSHRSYSGSPSSSSQVSAEIVSESENEEPPRKKGRTGQSEVEI
ncbi:hypothetical protein FRC07_005095, partial [Ceratobasidium sp. 392]